MKKLFTFALLLALALALPALTAPAQDAPKKKSARKERVKKAGPKEEARTLRVLVTYGGHAFEEPQFWAMWDSFPGLKVSKAKLPDEADKLKPGLEKEFDVLVRYDMVKTFTPEQQQNFEALLKTGIAFVPLHHNLGAHPTWPEYRKMIGGAYVFKAEKIDGKDYVPSTYKHDQDLPIAVADERNPITRRIKPFTIHDEAYGHPYVVPGVHLLLTCDHPESGKEIAWTTTYGKSPVFYLMLGHDSKAWDNPAFREILLRGIRWAARENASPEKKTAN